MAPEKSLKRPASDDLADSTDNRNMAPAKSRKRPAPDNLVHNTEILKMAPEQSSKRPAPDNLAHNAKQLNMAPEKSLKRPAPNDLADSADISNMATEKPRKRPATENLVHSAENLNMAPEKSRKRSAPGSTVGDTFATDAVPERRVKRQRHDEAKFIPATASNGAYLTPPRSAPYTPTKPAALKGTMSLKLQIPEHVPTVKEKRDLGARKGAAKRWVGKLQNPFPNNSEIKKAYPLKLMRHYPAAPAAASSTAVGPATRAPTATPVSSGPSSSPESETKPPVDNFVKPMIQKSARVNKLLKTFPSLTIPAEVDPYKQCLEKAALTKERKEGLQNFDKNEVILNSRGAMQEAWKSFAEPEDDWPNRDIMVQSALPIEDLQNDYRGLPNDLPEWKKWKTSRFFRKDQDGRKGKVRISSKRA